MQSCKSLLRLLHREPVTRPALESPHGRWVEKAKQARLAFLKLPTLTRLVFHRQSIYINPASRFLLSLSRTVTGL